MTRAADTRANEQRSRIHHDTLVERHERAHVAWSQQVAVANAMRAGRDIGPGDEADHASTYAHLGEQDALTDALRAQLDDLATAIQRSDNGMDAAKDAHTRSPLPDSTCFPPPRTASPANNAWNAANRPTRTDRNQPRDIAIQHSAITR